MARGNPNGVRGSVLVVEDDAASADLLAARLDAHLRKVAALPAGHVSAPALEEAPVPSDVRTFGEVDIDLEARMARIKGRPVTLGSLEFRLLDYFVRNAGVALSREQILR